MEENEKKSVLQVMASKVAASAHVYRQILATFAVSMLALTAGLSLGFTAVLLPQLQADPSFPYDVTYDSWIASITPLAMMMGSLVSGTFSDTTGRKMGQLVVIVPYTLGWILMGVANTNTVVLIGRFITGVCRGSLRASSAVYIGEISDPKYRAVGLLCCSVAFHVGVLISHTVGKYYHWKTSCYIFTLPNIIAFVILLFLKESPLWLLSKGKNDEGIHSFRQFRGNGDNAEKELAIALEKIKEKAEENTTFKDILSIIFSKPFMKSLTAIFLLSVSAQWCGVSTLTFYAQTIFEKTFSGDVDAYMLMVVTDCIRIAAAVLVCLFAKVLPRKVFFLICCASTALVLTGLVVYLYLAPIGLVWVAVTCLIVYIAAATSLVSIATSFASEVFPLKLRSFGSGLSAALSFALLFISVKVTPEIIHRFGEIVMYACFAGVTFFTGVILIFILPETNNRSLQDIEDSLYKKKGDVNQDVGMITLTAL